MKFCNAEATLFRICSVNIDREIHLRVESLFRLFKHLANGFHI